MGQSLSETTAFANIANIVGGYAFKGADLGATGFPVIKIAEISPPRIEVKSAERIPFEKVYGLDRFKLRNGDILMAMTGATTGKVGRIRYTEPAYLNQRVARISAKAGPDFDDYVWAIVSQPRFEELVLANAHGSAQPNVSSDGIGRIQITKLPENSQIKIGRITRSLDDKIEQNRRTGRALEGLARAIFKAWFVDFEPVKAKAAGQTSFPGMPPAVFAALPDCLTDSPLGPVPQGWAVGTMGNVGEQRREQVAPDGIDGETPYIGLEHMPRRDITLSKWGTAATVTSSKFRFRCGDTLFGKLRPYFHKVGPAPLDGVCSTDIVVLYSKRPECAAWLLMLVSTDDFVSHTDRTSAGTKMPRTNWKDMAAFPIALPPSSVATAYQDQVGPMLDMIHLGIHVSSKLAALRDYLLPRLLSGRVRVKGVTDE